MKKVLIVFISLFIMFSFSLLWAQDEMTAKDPDDFGSYEKPDTTPSKSIMVNGKIVQQPVLKTQKAFTLRERNKLAQIANARVLPEGKSVSPQKYQEQAAARSNR
jgi:hypothetical protein